MSHIAKTIKMTILKPPKQITSARQNSYMVTAPNVRMPFRQKVAHGIFQAIFYCSVPFYTYLNIRNIRPADARKWYD